MQIKVNGEAVDLHFGVAFLRKLDKINGMKIDMRGVPVSLGFGMLQAMPALRTYDSSVLAQVIYCAAYENDEITQDAVDNYIDSLTVKQLESLFQKVEKELNNSNVVQLSVKNMKA